jgi:hypothetical protein
MTTLRDDAAGNFLERLSELERYPYKALAQALAPYEDFMLGREDLLLHPRRLPLSQGSQGRSSHAGAPGHR